MPEAGGADGVPALTDDEVLYRSVWLKPICFSFDEEGILRVSAQAFSDASKQVSLFRHILCEDPPHSNPPRLGPDQAVASFLAGKIREAGPVLHQPGKEAVITYRIHVEPDVSGGQHPAHALVFSDPDFKNSRPFEKLKIRLAQLVEALVIPPPPEFVDELRNAAR